MTQRTEAGDTHGYVGEIIDPDWTPNQTPVDPVKVPVASSMKPMPEPGIYFGMPEDDYHAVHALSSSGVKRMIASSMEYWAYSRMNPDFEEIASKWFNHGKATHKLVLEGEDEYQRSYAVDLDPAEFEDADILVSTDEIKSAIGRHTEVCSVSPVQGGKQDLIDQLADLGRDHGQEVDLDGTVPQLKERIRAFRSEQPVKPVSRVKLDDGSTRSAAKEDWIDQLLALQPDVRIWDRMVALHLQANEGKTMISAKDDRRVRIGAHMIAKHPDAGPMLTGGHAEVSIFWYCPVTGVPMKARIDYLKLRAILDLKTFSNQQGMPVGKAIERAIANYRYNVQHVVYDQAVRAGREIVSEKGLLAIFSCDDADVDTHMQRVEWCERWCALVEEPPKFVFIFQQSGIAPVTRVRGMPRLEVFKASHRLLENMKFKWRECAQTFGIDPWLDHERMKEIDDEAIPLYATETENFYD